MMSEKQRAQENSLEEDSNSMTADNVPRDQASPDEKKEALNRKVAELATKGLLLGTMRNGAEMEALHVGKLAVDAAGILVSD
jgi:hypothetical protein